jgi:hypothetical protein
MVGEPVSQSVLAELNAYRSVAVLTNAACAAFTPRRGAVGLSETIVHSTYSRRSLGGFGAIDRYIAFRHANPSP